MERKIDPAMALSLAKAATESPAKQVEATNVLRGAEQLRALPGYNALAGDPQAQQALRDGQLSQLNDKFYPLLQQANQQENAPVAGNQEIAAEADQRQNDLGQGGPNLNNN